MSATTQTPTTGETVEQSLARAQAAAQAKRYGEASGICNDVLTTSPEHPSALALLGMIAAHQGQPERAVTLMERAVAKQPGMASWHGNLCTLYRLLCRMPEALEAGNQAVRLSPNSSEFLVNLSLVFSDIDQRERAMACLLRALGQAPTHADAHLALAQNLLAVGEMAPGWLEYEWRNETEAGKGQLPKMTSAHWNGMRIPGGRILLVGDQGYGDTIQFCRYIPMVAERCSEVILGCSQEMMPLLSRVPGVTHFRHRWNEIPGHAAHCRLSTLPSLFNTTLETIPSKVPYLFAEPGPAAAWAEKLAARLPAGTRRIGLAWKGRPTHPNDRRRTQPLSRLLPFADAGTASFVSLQKPFPDSDLAVMDRFPGMTDTSAELTDFGETAGLIANLDMVITVDTAMGHLAAAMGKPTWIMVPKASDWRWLLDRSDSPWYPTVRLFRQRNPGEWDPVIAEVAAALAVELRLQGAEIAAD